MKVLTEASQTNQKHLDIQDRLHYLVIYPQEQHNYCY